MQAHFGMAPQDRLRAMQCRRDFSRCHCRGLRGRFDAFDCGRLGARCQGVLQPGDGRLDDWAAIPDDLPTARHANFDRLGASPLAERETNET
jgi:hypothetical protein